MRVTVTVPETTACVDLGPEDIADALLDAPNEKCEWVLNNVGRVLRAIGDRAIANMTDAQRAVVHAFLSEQAARYAPVKPAESMSAAEACASEDRLFDQQQKAWPYG